MRWAVAVVVLVAGCSDDGERLAARAEQVRELPFLAAVAVDRVSREAYAAEAAAYAENLDHALLYEYGQTYGRLGYFDPALDLVPIVAGSRSDWVGATYSPSSKRITLVGDASDDSLVHEYVHALQDQHFVISDYDLHATSDGFLARRALVEGDATLAQYRFTMQERYGAELDALDWQAAFERLRAFSDGLLLDSDYPPIFLDYPSFCYAYGLEHDAYNLTGVRIDDPESLRPGPYDWRREDELFLSRPADTTQQVLRLSIAEELDETITFGGLVPEATAERYETVDVDSLGEWGAALLFVSGGMPLEEARALAAAWDGDRVDFLRDADTDEYATAWVSAWDDVDAAAAVVQAMWASYGRRTTLWQPFLFALAFDDEPVWIEQRGARVVAIKNLEPAEMPALAEHALAAAPMTTRLLRRAPSLVEYLAREPHRAR